MTAAAGRVHKGVAGRGAFLPGPPGDRRNTIPVPEERRSRRLHGDPEPARA